MRQRFTPGTGFKDGKLYEFTPTRLVVTRAWPKPAAWKLEVKDRMWRGYRPQRFFLPRGEPEALAQQLEAAQADPRRLAEAIWLRSWLGVCAAIPRPVLDIVRGYGPNARHFHLLSLAARCAGGLELLDPTQGNPALATMLASAWVFSEQARVRPLRFARSMLRHKRRDIAAALGIPQTDAAVRVIAKLNASECSVEALLYLRLALRNDVVLKRLGHLPRLDRRIIRLASDPKVLPLVRQTLLLELSTTVSNDHPAALARDLTELEATAKLLGRPLSPLRSLRDLSTARASLNSDLYDYDILTDLSLAPPPFAGTPQIVPLRSVRQLESEGLAMNHCAAHLVDAASAGKVAVYRVLEPQRATLSLERGASGWQLQELRGPGNAPVSAQTVAAVHLWLASAQHARLQGAPS